MEFTSENIIASLNVFFGFVAACFQLFASKRTPQRQIQPSFSAPIKLYCCCDSSLFPGAKPLLHPLSKAALQEFLLIIKSRVISFVPLTVLYEWESTGSSCSSIKHQRNRGDSHACCLEKHYVSPAFQHLLLELHGLVKLQVQCRQLGLSNRLPSACLLPSRKPVS